MKGLALATVVALLALPVTAAEDFSGIWTGSFNTVGPDGKETQQSTIYMNAVHKGAELTGTAGPTSDQQSKILKGKVDGANVTFDVETDGTTISFKLAFAEGHLKGEASGEGHAGEKRSAKVDMTRKKGLQD